MTSWNYHYATSVHSKGSVVGVTATFDEADGSSKECGPRRARQIARRHFVQKIRTAMCEEYEGTTVSIKKPGEVAKVILSKQKFHSY